MRKHALRATSIALAVCSSGFAASSVQPRSSIAIAACSFEISVAANDGLLTEIQVTPAGFFKPHDGRQLSVPGWYMDAANAQQVIQRFKARKTPLVIDYEHQTLRKEENGQPAPAAAWFRDLTWREGQGLFATVELTAKARDAIDGKEYLYFSPVFRYDAKGNVLALEMGALTNTPAVDGMEQLTLRAAACFGADDLEDTNVNLLQALIAALALKPDATEEQAIAALNARLEEDPLKELRAALGVDDKADTPTLVAACTALKAKTPEKPDPSQYVPVSTLTAVQGEIAALSAKLQARDQKDTEALIESALADGRLLKPMESWARELAKKDVAALNSYLQAAAPLAALNNSQTGGQAPVVTDESGLTHDELAVCNAMGVTPEEFKKAKPAA